MKNTRQLAVIAALGMLAFATGSAKATLLDVTITGSVTTQLAPTTSNGKITYKTEKTSVSTDDILNTLATIKGLGTLPSGAKLVYNNTPHVTPNDFPTWTIRNKDNGIIGDVSENISVAAQEGSTKTGTKSTSSTDESTTTSFFGTIAIAPGNQNAFALNGLVTDKLSVKGEKTTETFTLKSGSGSAKVNGNFGSCTGTVTGKSQK